MRHTSSRQRDAHPLCVPRAQCEADCESSRAQLVACRGSVAEMQVKVQSVAAQYQEVPPNPSPDSLARGARPVNASRWRAAAASGGASAPTLRLRRARSAAVPARHAWRLRTLRPPARPVPIVPGVPPHTRACGVAWRGVAWQASTAASGWLEQPSHAQAMAVESQ